MSHPENLNSEEEDLLQSALSTAFTPASLPRQSAVADLPSTQVPETPDSTLQDSPAVSETNPGEPESADTVWKEEYEAHVAEWRRRSAEQRQKAEEKREEWEAIREKERKDGKTQSSSLSASTGEWENVSGSVVTATGSPSPADVRDLVSGEGQGGHTEEYVQSVLPGSGTSAPPAVSTPPDQATPPSHPASEPDSKQDKWDSMASSLTSSLPSMSFPSDPHSPISTTRRDLPSHHASHHVPGHTHGHGHEHQHRHPSEAARTATISILDNSLSPKTRALALLSSIAINVLLPFVNGVMLGFGEIFAKDVVMKWLGWKVPGTASAARSSGSGRIASTLGAGKR